MKLLVCNVGSTSLKFKLFDMDTETPLCQGKVERVGSLTDAIYAYHHLGTGYQVQEEGQRVPGYADGIRRYLDDMLSPEHGALESLEQLGAVGFKTVLAKDFYGVHELTDQVLDAMRARLSVAPAHNRPYLEAIGLFRELLPGVRMVGVFETAFHTTIPLARRMYAIPYEWYEKYGLMKMGYHGASHGYIARRMAQRFGGTGKVVSCHLGGSCSLCAIQDGKSVDTTFGFSLQSGIPHANRVGDADPYLVPFLLSEGLSMEEILDGLAKRGGMLGISGVANDMRPIQQAAQEGNARAQLAIDVFVQSLLRSIGAFYAEMGGLDHLVFTGGIGENSAAIRAEVCRQLSHMGILLDEQANRELKGEGCITQPGSPVDVWVIPANEEAGVAFETYRCVQSLQ